MVTAMFSFSCSKHEGDTGEEVEQKENLYNEV